MGLFAEALRARAHDPEVAQLVNSINESVDALEGLFSELLDITPHRQRRRRGPPRELRARRHLPQGAAALRAGGVREGPGAAHPRRPARRLRRPAAGRADRPQPGLERDPLHAATARCCSAAGGAASGCCCRSGTPARASAPTSARASSRSSTRCPGRGGRRVEQKKGLGLGLAIVKRLCALMAAPLDAALGGRPRLGLHGRAAARQGAPRAAARSIPGKGPIGITLDGRLIVIVEDEPAVREGLEVLLTGWGATHRLARQRRRDARLGRGRRPRRRRRSSSPTTGSRTARPASPRSPRCASASARGVPAIVVTGSSMTGHDKEALEHDFHLLIKPVLPNKLRAMIAFKLGRR